MAGILQMKDRSDEFLSKKVLIFWFKYHRIAPQSLIDNKLALVVVMAWHWIGIKPLPASMMIQSTDAYRQFSNIRHTQSQNINVSRLV